MKGAVSVLAFFFIQELVLKHFFKPLRHEAKEIILLKSIKLAVGITIVGNLTLPT